MCDFLRFKCASVRYVQRNSFAHFVQVLLGVKCERGGGGFFRPIEIGPPTNIGQNCSLIF
jgi:hypothetical protein